MYASCAGTGCIGTDGKDGNRVHVLSESGGGFISFCEGVETNAQQ